MLSHEIVVVSVACLSFKMIRLDGQTAVTRAKNKKLDLPWSIACKRIAE